MKVYKFIFIVGFLNLTIPFLGIPFFYKNYILLSIAVITIAYSLIIRAVEKENEAFGKTTKSVENPTSNKTIEEIVEMKEHHIPKNTSDVVINKRGRKPKIIIQEKFNE